MCFDKSSATDVARLRAEAALASPAHLEIFTSRTFDLPYDALVADLPKLAVRSLSIHDRAVAFESSLHPASTGPDSRVLHLNGCGHLVRTEHAEEFNATMTVLVSWERRRPAPPTTSTPRPGRDDGDRERCDDGYGGARRRHGTAAIRRDADPGPGHPEHPRRRGEHERPVHRPAYRGPPLRRLGVRVDVAAAHAVPRPGVPSDSVRPDRRHDRVALDVPGRSRDLLRCRRSWPAWPPLS
ncbi:hypothetical protein SCANM124S_01020 [Streptomyces canus]